MNCCLVVHEGLGTRLQAVVMTLKNWCGRGDSNNFGLELLELLER